MNGKKTIFVGVIPKSTGNPLTLARGVGEILKELELGYPKGFVGTVVWDNANLLLHRLLKLNIPLSKQRSWLF